MTLNLVGVQVFESLRMLERGRDIDDFGPTNHSDFLHDSEEWIAAVEHAKVLAGCRPSSRPDCWNGPREWQAAVGYAEDWLIGVLRIF
jgi:hypothetical protein